MVFDCYVGEERKYHGLVSRDLPSAPGWTEISGSFDLPKDVRLMRCLLYQVGVGTSWFDDVKYNSSPDVTWHDGRLVYVYNKFEHLYGSRTDLGKLYGCFLGTITPVDSCRPLRES